MTLVINPINVMDIYKNYSKNILENKKANSIKNRNKNKKQRPQYAIDVISKMLIGISSPNNHLYQISKNNNISKKKIEIKKKKEIRCGGIILNTNLDSIVIVLNRDSMLKGENKWGLPKGHINEGESLIKCAEREIEEETGLKLKIGSNIPRIKINDTFYYIFILDDNKIKNFKQKDKKEIAIVKWEIIKNVKYINTNRGLKKMLNILPKILKLSKKK